MFKRKKELKLLIPAVILFCMTMVVIFLSFSHKSHTVNDVYKAAEGENNNVADASEPLGGLVYREYDGEIVNISDTATVCVTVSGAADTDDIVVTLVNCNTGKKLEQNYSGKIIFENVDHGTYAVAAYNIDGSKYEDTDIMVDITYDIKENGNVINLFFCLPFLKKY